MACPAVITGDQFLTRIITHIDCQAQILGSYGYQSLGTPGSYASTFMLALLTLFVALFGYRLLFGPAPAPRDLVGDVIKIGLVLTLAFSWPAFRTVIYNVTLQAPADIAASITSPSLSPAGSNLLQRLQQTDNALVNLTEVGMGRNTGAFIDSGSAGGTFQASVLEDDSALSLARLAYLSGIIGALAALRVLAGLLLAIAPLAAVLLLFEQTRGLFSGWLRGLVLALIGSLGIAVTLSAQLSVMEPWLADALRVRALGYATPSAPTEILAITLAFAIAQFAVLWVLAKVAFTRGWPAMPHWTGKESSSIEASSAPSARVDPAIFIANRAARTADSMRIQMRREERLVSERMNGNRTSDIARGRLASARSSEQRAVVAEQRLGNSYRRARTRSSVAASKRDSTS